MLCELFCGVGALAVKGALRVPGLKAICSDPNPAAVDLCKHNILLNNLKGRASAFNRAPRNFLKLLIEEGNSVPENYFSALNLVSDRERDAKLTVPFDCLCFNHCVLNLPVDGIEYLDVFHGLLRDANPHIWRKDPQDPRTLRLPHIHIYAFTEEADRDEAVEEFRNRIAKAI